MPQEYSFLTPWRFDKTSIFEVADILEDTASLPRWWPDLFKSVTIQKPGGEHALGQVANGSTISSLGDLIGTGIWRLAERDGGVDVEYEWRVRLEKPLLKLVSPIARPFLANNHEWSMRRGYEGLCAEVVRRRPASEKVQQA